MKTVLTLALSLISVFTANAYKYTYNFSNTPISRAIVFGTRRQSENLIKEPTEEISVG